MEGIGNNLDLLSSEHENIMMIGDFNAEPTGTAVYDFCDIYNLANLVKKKTCFKKTWVNKLALTNSKKQAKMFPEYYGD